MGLGIDKIWQMIGNQKESNKATYAKATVLRKDNDGTIWVKIEGGVDETPVYSTTADVKPNDVVTVKVAGGKVYIEGSTSSPSVGVTEFGDTINIVNKNMGKVDEKADKAVEDSEAALAAAKEAEEATDVARVTGQHFWVNDDEPETYGGTGAHVTEQEKDDWVEAIRRRFPDLSDNKPYHNILMNSFGILLRTALNNLVSITRSSISFFDGLGNTAANVVASFGKDGAVIGPSDLTRMIINSNGLKGIGGLSVPFLDVKLEGDPSEVLISEMSKKYYYSTDGLDISFDLDTFIETNYDLDDGDEIIITVYYAFTSMSVANTHNFSFNIGTPYRKESTSTYGDTVVIIYDGEQHVQSIITLPDNATIDSYDVTVKLYKTFRIPSFVFGLGEASGAFSVSEGLRTASLGDATHAEGEKTTASGNTSHAEGCYTIASGDHSHAEGNKTTASGPYSHAEGNVTSSYGTGSHAEGAGTKAYFLAHAEGNGTTAAGSRSHAEGYATGTTGENSHAEGYITNALGENSHAEGRATTARGNNSHAEGRATTASGENSHAQNYYTRAASDNQTAIGKFNIEDANNVYALIIGNGTADDARSNAFTVDWDGNIDFSGKIPVSRLSWAGTTDNLVATATDNDQEWSIDLTPGSYTGTYWQVWSAKLSDSIIRCYADDGHVVIPHGLFEKRGSGSSSGIWTIATNMTRDEQRSEQKDAPAFVIGDASYGTMGRMCVRHEGGTNKNHWNMFEINRVVNGTSIWNSISIGINKDGSLLYYVSSPANFRSAIGEYNYVRTTNNATYISGGYIEILRRGNAIQYNFVGLVCKTYSGRQTVATIPDGFRPLLPAYGQINGNTDGGYFIVDTNGEVKVDSQFASGKTLWGSTVGLRE